MWFSNAIIYRLTRDIEFTPETLEKQAAEFPYVECSSQSVQSFGWTKPLGTFGEMLTHVAGDAIFMCAMSETRAVPAQVLKKAVDDTVTEMESEQGRKLKKGEKAGIREKQLIKLLPRAFSKYTRTQLVIMPKEGLIIVDAGSYKKAEDVLALLRKTIGSLPVVPYSPEKPFELTLTDWVRHSTPPSGWEIGTSCKLEGVLDGSGVARFKDEDLACDEVLAHIDNEKLVTELAMNWRGQFSFVIDSKLVIKRLKFSDELKDKNDDIDREDMAQRLDADFILLAGELSAFYDNVAAVMPLAKVDVHDC